MARSTRLDRGLHVRLDELERKIFQLRVAYEKYFSGIERFEPMRERDELRRLVRDMTREPVPNTGQRFRFQTLKARYTMMEQYITRNLVMVERGTHPRFRFRADLAGRSLPPQLAAQRRKAREDAALRVVYDRYLEARRHCGQNTDIGFPAMRDALRKQVRVIKSRYRCTSVKLRVTIEDGKARVKAVPRNPDSEPR